MAFATVDDYENLTGLTVAVGAETTRIEALLDDATEAILSGAHDQAIAEATYTDVVLYPHEGYCYFPQRPVSAVASVAVNQPNGTPEALAVNTDYRWTTGGNGRHAKLIRVRNDRDDYWRPDDKVTVTYTAGWSTIPAQIRNATVALVRGVVLAAGEAPKSQVTVGPFSVSTEEGDRQSPTMTLTPSAQAILDRWCGVRGHQSVPVRVG